MIRSSNDETKFPHRFLLINTPVAKIRKAFANDSSADTKFSKIQLSKIIQSGGILDKLRIGIPFAILHAGKEALKKV